MIYNNDKLIAAAFVKARAAIGGTVKEDGAGNYGAYATLAAITKATSKALADNNLAIIQEATLTEQGVVISSTLLHESGATIEFAPLPMPLTNRTPQAVGSAITYGRRYALAAICGLAPDDDDGQAAQDATQAAPATKPARAPSKTQQGAPVQPTEAKPRITEAQLAEIERLGEIVYPTEFAANKPRLAELFSQGARTKLEDLYELEAEKLIKGLEKKIQPVAH